MTDVVIKLFILLIGFGMGMCVTFIIASKAIVDKYDLKQELKKVKHEKDLLEKELSFPREQTINIIDTSVGNDVEFGNF